MELVTGVPAVVLVLDGGVGQRDVLVGIVADGHGAGDCVAIRDFGTSRGLSRARVCQLTCPKEACGRATFVPLARRIWSYGADLDGRLGRSEQGFF